MSVKINVGVTYNGKNIQKAFRDLNTLRKNADNTSDRLKAMSGQASLIGKTMSTAGQKIARNFTLPLIAVGAAAVRSSVDFDTAFTGVIKTVDATEQQLEGLRSGIRQMATELPATASEIADVASAAGQLGIQTDSILGFTRVMIDLGETTNLTADEAATSFARFANILQTPQDEFDRLGSTVVDLGNNLATTEAEILELGMRLAAAGGQIGLTEAEILAFAAALSSVGVEAEAGGSAFSRLFLDINSAVIAGGENLTAFAAIAGMSAQQFATAFREDAANAVRIFIAGLGRIKDGGGDVSAALETVGLGTIRIRDALGRAAGAGDLLTRALELGTNAFEENTALAREAELRYESTGAQFEIFRNRVNDAAIEIGDALAPALLDALDAVKPFIDGVKDLAERFAGLEEEQQKNLIKWGLIIAVGTPLALFALSAIASIASITASLYAMGGAVAVATGGLSLLAAAIIGVGFWAFSSGADTATTSLEHQARAAEHAAAGYHALADAELRAADAAKLREDRQTNEESRSSGRAARLARRAAETEAAAAAERAMADAMSALGEATKSSGDEIAASGPKVVALSDEMRDALQDINFLAAGMDNGGEYVAQFARELLAAGEITDDVSQAAVRLAQVVKQDIDRSLADANRRLEEATKQFEAYRDAIAEGITQGNRLSDAASSQSSAIERLAQAGEAYQDALASEDPDRIAEAADQLEDAKDAQGSFVEFLQTGLTTAEGFANQIDALRLAGASMQVVQEIAELGARTGGRIAAELLAGGAAAIEQANALVAATEAAARRAGDAAAQQFYGAGVRAAQGFVAAVEASIPALQGVLDRIADMIEAALGARPEVRLDGGQTFVKPRPGATAPAAMSPLTQTQVNAIYSTDWGALSQQLGGLGGIPAMADGGIVMGPTLALIGEAGPEAVVPLSRGMGRGQTIVNVTVTSADPQAVVEAIRRYTRSNGPLGSSVAL